MFYIYFYLYQLNKLTCLIALVSGDETCFNNCSKLAKYCCC